jgi:hypothetical protein
VTPRSRHIAQAATGLLLGALTWALSVPITGSIEPFDSPSPYYLSAMFLAGAAASLWSPRSAWLAVVAIFVGERLYILLALPQLRSTWLLGWILNAIIPTWWPAALAALLVYLGARLRSARRL